MDERIGRVEPDFKGLRHSKIGYFKEVRSKIKELETLNIQLARRHNRLDAIFNSMNDGVTILDRNLNIVFSNRVQKQMFPEISESTMNCHQIFYQRDSRCPNCPVLKTLDTGEMLRGEYMFKKGHLAGRYFEWTTSPIEGPRGNVDEIILIMRDISERKEYEFRLMQTDRMVSVGFLATSLAHEINNPLTSIAGFSEGLLKRLRNKNMLHDEKILTSFKEYLEIINSEAYRCKEIIQRLREFNSSISDEYEPLYIDQILQETISLIRQHAKDHQIRIVFKNQLAAGFNRLLGKNGQLKHLFLNVFKQLFSVMKSGGELYVIAQNDGEKIDVSVSDPDGSLCDALSGHQVNEQVENCFTKSREKMELSVCYNIIRHHQGEVRSERSGDGDSRLIIRFPAELTE
ncbi:MAG: histidine kinase dimerization/phospho-acceptor domain-containing protein [Desulfobacteraceae bacterium]